jgi:pyruvate/2-oxoglutarate dehydrogenase complex dihydrolipoamide dehydrogenase (E3) component
MGLCRSIGRNGILRFTVYTRLFHAEVMQSSSPANTFDAVVLGGGSAGYAAARTLAGSGLKTAIVEGADRMGGLCILRGCMPSKALLQAAEVRHLARHAATWGIRVPEAALDLSAVMRRKDALIESFAQHRQAQLTSGRFSLVRAQARFGDPHTLILDHGERLTAAHIVIATGSTVAPPPLPELAQVGYWTSDEVLAMDRVPPSVAVLGGGPIALELAQLLARFGSEVTLIQRSARVLREFDADAAQALEAALRREGIRLMTGTRLTGAGRCGNRKFVQFEHAGQTTRIEAEELLMALGRHPNLAGLDLERAGVRVERGRIVTDAQQRTSQAHIFAAGDCTGPHQIVHLAVRQGEIAAHNIARPQQPRAFDQRLLLQVVFTDPQVATVGLTEHQAHLRQIPFLSASYPFNDHGKSMILDVQEGFVKLLATPGSGEILGGTAVGPVAGELIHEITVAMAKRMTVHELAAVPHYHPTLAEIWTYPAEELADRIPPMPGNAP